MRNANLSSHTLIPIFLFFFLIFTKDVNSQTFTTQEAGLWSSEDTWEDGNIPPSTLSNDMVFIEHDVEYDGSNDIIIEDNASLVVRSGANFNYNQKGKGIQVHGAFRVLNAQLSHFSGVNGDLFVYEGATVEFIGSIIAIAQNWQLEGNSTNNYVNSCMLVGENYLVKSSASNVLFDNCCLEVGAEASGSFENNEGNTITFANSNRILVPNGNFKNEGRITSSDTDCSGTSPIEILLVGNGNLTNVDSKGTWNASISEYFVSGNIEDEEPINSMCSANPAVSNETCACQSLLPVTLVSFQAKALDQHVELEWVTASELAFDAFILEKEIEGEFKQIGEIRGNGAEAIGANYSFQDLNPLAGDNIYRLAMVDLDGSMEYSELVSANFNKPIDIRIHPNPFNDFFSISWLNETTAINFIYVFDVSGKVVFSLEQVLEKGFQNIQVMLPELPSGFYIARIHSNGQLIEQELIKK